MTGLNEPLGPAHRPGSPPHDRLVVRSPGDLLALVPRLLGFHPEESIVMLTFDRPGESLHARVDLPPPALLRPMVAPLVAAAVRHRVQQMAFVLYSDDPERVAAAWAHLDGLFARRRVRFALHRHGRLLTDLRNGATETVDLTSHPLVARSVFDGVVMLPSRADLARSIAADASACAALAAVLPEHLRALPGRATGVEAAWACRQVLEGASGDPVLGDEEAARLAVGLSLIEEVRMAVVAALRRPRAPAAIEVLTGLVRRCPDPVVAGPAALLALACWLDGHGALAWCAVDRAREGDPECVLAGLVAGLLECAEPPSTWDRVLADLEGAGVP